MLLVKNVAKCFRLKKGSSGTWPHYDSNTNTWRVMGLSKCGYMDPDWGYKKLCVKLPQ